MTARPHTAHHSAWKLDAILMAPSTRTHAARKKEAEEKQEALYAEASTALNDGTHKNMSEAAVAFSLDYTTFRRRHLQLARSRSNAHKDEKLLTDSQENVVCDWVQFLGMTGHPVSKLGLRAKVFDLSEKLQVRGKETGENGGPGTNWVDNFLKRHPEIKLSRPSGLDPKRAKCFNRTTVTHHFSLLKHFLDSNNIPWENVYNMDEKGIQLGGGRTGDNTKYLYSRSQKARSQVSSGNLELVTVIECVGADGSSIKPGFIFSGTEFHPEWFNEDDILVATSENGWTSDFIGAEWFEKIFVPQAKAHNESGQPILLIYDGHRSHETVKLRQLAEVHEIHLFCLPAHTTHKLQPLDVGVFGPLQNAWRKGCGRYLEDHGNEITKKQLISEYMTARKSAFKTETILHAWRKCGIRPLNPEIFTETDFAPSYTTSTSLHVPSTFPQQPSSPIASEESTDDSSYVPSETETEVGDSMQDIVDHDDQDDQSLTVCHGDTGGQTPLCSTQFSQPGQSAGIAGPSYFPGLLEGSISEGSSMPAQAYIHSSSPAPSKRPNTNTKTHRRMSSRLSTRSNTPSVSNPSHFSSCSSRRSTPVLSSSHHEACLAKELEQARAQISELKSRNKALENENKDLWGAKDAAETHCSFASKMLEDLKRKLNEKSATRGKGTRKLNTTSRVLTSEEGRTELRQLEVQEKEQQELAEKRVKKKAEEDRQRQQRRAQQNKTAVFSGLLYSKKKEELSDIAACLCLDDQGTIAILLERIRACLEANPTIKQSERYAQLRLDHQRTRGTKRPDHEEETSLPGPSQPKRACIRSSDASIARTTNPGPSGPSLTFTPDFIDSRTQV